MIKRKFGQEEIVGFALIIIIVGVILLVILGLSLRGKGSETVQSYEAGSFIQAFLQYTSTCSDNSDYLSVQELINSCNKEEECDDGAKACDVLDSTLTEIVEKSWKVDEETPVKGYKIGITSKENEEGNIKEILSLEKGDKTSNYQSSTQLFSRQGTDYEVKFTAYS